MIPDYQYHGPESPVDAQDGASGSEDRFVERLFLVRVALGVRCRVRGNVI
jgi:hypothetical protein